MAGRNHEYRKRYQRWIHAARRAALGELKQNHLDEYESLYIEAKTRIPFQP